MQNNRSHHHHHQQQQHIIEIIDEEEDGQGIAVHESNRPVPPSIAMPPGSTNRMHAGVRMGVAAARRTSNAPIMSGNRNHADAGNANPGVNGGAGSTITYERVPHGGHLAYGYGARSTAAMNSSHNHINAQVALQQQQAATRTAGVWQNQRDKFHTAGVPGRGGRPSGQAVKKKGPYGKAVSAPCGKKKATSSSQSVKNKLPGNEKNVAKKKIGNFAAPPTIPTINVKRKAIITDTNLLPPAQKRKRDSTSETTKKNEDKEVNINQVTNPITAKDVANIDLGNQEEAIAMTNLFVRQLIDNFINASYTSQNNKTSTSNENANKNPQNNKTNKNFVKDSNANVKNSNIQTYFVSTILSSSILNREEASKMIMDVARMYADSDSINGDVAISEQTVQHIEHVFRDIRKKHVQRGVAVAYLQMKKKHDSVIAELRKNFEENVIAITQKITGEVQSLNEERNNAVISKKRVDEHIAKCHEQHKKELMELDNRRKEKLIEIKDNHNAKDKELTKKQDALQKWNKRRIDLYLKASKMVLNSQLIMNRNR